MTESVVSLPSPAIPSSFAQPNRRDLPSSEEYSLAHALFYFYIMGLSNVVPVNIFQM